MRRSLLIVGVITPGVVAAVFALSLVWAEAIGALPEVPAKRFAPSARCSPCHDAQIMDWKTSMHAKAYSDPVFTLKKKRADRASGGALAVFCDRCHTPIGTMAGQTAPGKKLSKQSKEGVTCDFCHQVTGTEEPIGNASQKVKANGKKRAQYKHASAPTHASVYSRFFTTAEFCAACHWVRHHTNGLALDTTYPEWAASSYARAGIVCQDCHMSVTPGGGPTTGRAAPMGPIRDFVYLMSFAGANVPLGDAERATANLKSAARIAIESSRTVESGAKGTVRVTVRNVGAGHYIPGGAAEIRQMWLEVDMVLPDGSRKRIGERTFGTVFEDARGHAPAEIWDAVAVASDDRIPPKGEATSTFSFAMPTADQIRLEAVLRYKSFTDDLAEQAGVENPTTEMTRASLPVFASQAALAHAVGESVDPRWIALGIIGAFAVLAALGFFLVVRIRRKRARRRQVQHNSGGTPD